MAWLARSIANSLKLDEDDDDDEKRRFQDDSGDESDRNQSVLESQSPRGVKEDISELTKTLRTQFWGVASFLSPPPSDLEERSEKTPDLVEEDGDEDLIAGIRNDFAEIGGRFRTGISKLSGNLPVTDFTKIASSFLQLGSDGVDSKNYDVGNAVGVTEELVAFVRDLAMHHGTWLDFPLPDEDDSFDDFEMTDAQHEHALAVEKLASTLAGLRFELCPAYMTENCFWMIYFVLVHPKLSQHDALLLSTPQVLEARALLSNELHKSNKAPMVAESSETNATNVEPITAPYNASSESAQVKTISPETVSLNNPSNVETEKHPIESKEIQVIDKSIIEERPIYRDKPVQQIPSTTSSRIIDVEVEDEDDADDWLKDEETTESINTTKVVTTIPLGEEEEEEDVSFSDLEEDEDEEDVAVSYKKVTHSSSDSSDKASPIRSGNGEERIKGLA